jgi:hypothetical protein
MSEGYARFYLGLYARKIFNPRAWWRFITFQSEYSMIFKASRMSLASAARRLLKRKDGGSAAKAAAPAKAIPAAVAAIPSTAAASRQAPGHSLSATSTVTGSGLQFNEDFLAAYRAVVSRGERILFVFGDNDNFKWEYESAFLEKYPGDVRAGEGLVTTEIIRDANHMYTLREWQHEVIQRCIRWLAASERESRS